MGRKSIMAIGIVAIFLMSSFAAIGARTVSMGQNKSSTPVPRITIRTGSVYFHCVDGGEDEDLTYAVVGAKEEERLPLGTGALMGIEFVVAETRSSHPGYQVTTKVIVNGEQKWNSTIRVPPDQERLIPMCQDVFLTTAPSKSGEVKTVDIFAEMKIVYENGRTITKTASATLKIRAVWGQGSFIKTYTILYILYFQRYRSYKVHGVHAGFYSVKGGEDKILTNVSLGTEKNEGEYLVVSPGTGVLMGIEGLAVETRSSHPEYLVTTKVIANGKEIWNGNLTLVFANRKTITRVVRMDVPLTTAPSKSGEVKTVDIFAEMKIVYDDGRTITKTASATLKIKSI